MSILVQVRGVVKSYQQGRGVLLPRRRIRALDGVDLSIRAGSISGLVGPSGSGKSTLARCVAGLEPIEGGEIRFDGLPIDSLRGRALRAFRRQVQLVFQDPASALNERFSIMDLVQEPLVIQGIGSRKERRGCATDLIRQVGLPPSVASRLPQELSGGQRQRVAIARALALEPRLLVLDEALSGLDLSVQAQLINLLLDLQERRSLTYLFISHDLATVGRIADEIAVIHRGRILETGTPADLFGNARHPVTRALLEAIPSIPEGITNGASESGIPPTHSRALRVSPR